MLGRLGRCGIKCEDAPHKAAAFLAEHWGVQVRGVDGLEYEKEGQAFGWTSLIYIAQLEQKRSYPGNK